MPPYEKSCCLDTGRLASQIMNSMGAGDDVDSAVYHRHLAILVIRSRACSLGVAKPLRSGGSGNMRIPCSYRLYMGGG